MIEFRIEPKGPFSLAAAQRFLGGFTPASGTFADADDRLTMAFPVDGWAGSAAAVVWQEGDEILGKAVVSSADVQIDAVRGQAPGPCRSTMTERAGTTLDAATR